MTGLLVAVVAGPRGVRCAPGVQICDPVQAGAADLDRPGERRVAVGGDPQDFSTLPSEVRGGLFGRQQPGEVKVHG